MPAKILIRWILFRNFVRCKILLWHSWCSFPDTSTLLNKRRERRRCDLCGKVQQLEALPVQFWSDY